MQPVLERGSIDKLLTFDVGLIQLSFHPVSVFVRLMHTKVFSIQMLQYFNQIVLRVCTLVLFIIKQRMFYILIERSEVVTSVLKISGT